MTINSIRCVAAGLLWGAAALVQAGTLGLGHDHSCAIANSAVYCWGDNSNGQLGDGSNTRRATPTKVSSLSNPVDVATGHYHSCALMRDGTAQCWGHNSYSELGDGLVVDRNTPVTVAGLTGAKALAAGTYHNCAIISDGTVRCWGYNRTGELGDGTTQSRTAVVTVPGLSGVTAIAAGGMHNCVVTGGAVKCWGANSSGQLGDGTTTPRTSPVTVSGISNAVGIATGWIHSCALLADGTAKCWGGNSSGQVGDNSSSTRNTPVAVDGLSGAVAIRTGGTHSCAMLATGDLRCWGDNARGQLGTTAVTYYTMAPLTVMNISAVTGFATGYEHSCAALTGGTLKCWGSNSYGQVDGSSSDRNLAVAVSLSGVGSVADADAAAPVLNWAERKFPTLLTPSGGLSSGTFDGYVYRAYSGSVYVAIKNGRAYFLAPGLAAPADVGSSADYYNQAKI